VYRLLNDIVVHHIVERRIEERYIIREAFFISTHPLFKALVNVARVRPILSEPSHRMRRAGTTRKLYQAGQIDVIQQPYGMRQVDMTLQLDATRQVIYCIDLLATDS